MKYTDEQMRGYMNNSICVTNDEYFAMNPYDFDVEPTKDELEMLMGGKLPTMAQAERIIARLDIGIIKLRVFEIPTVEWIDAFGSFVAEEIEDWDLPPYLLEVGAGSGRVSHFLNERSFGFEAIATDDFSWDIAKPFPVTPLNYKDALREYPGILALSIWMPYTEDWTLAFRRAKVPGYFIVSEGEGGCVGGKGTHREVRPYKEIELELPRQFSRTDYSDPSRHPHTWTFYFRRMI